MQSVQPMTKKKQDYVSLCFDIDGCLTMLVPSCKKMPSFYKDALLEKIKTIVFPQLAASKILNTQITLRLFTNRKDAPSDRLNARDNKTPLAHLILAEMRDIVSSWLGDGSTLIFDDRLHITQVDDPEAHYYPRTLQKYASVALNHIPKPFDHKCDLAATILADLAHQDYQHRVYFFDDRLHTQANEKGLDTLKQFFLDNPQSIPSNCQIHLFPCDLFIDYVQHLNKLYDYYEDMHKKGTFEGSLYAKDIAAILSTQQFSRQNPEAADTENHNTKLKAILSLAYGVNLNTPDGFADYMQQQQVFADKTNDPKKNDVEDIITVQGSGNYPVFSNLRELWHYVLVPMTQAYQNYLLEPTSGTNPFLSNDGQLPIDHTLVDVQTAGDVAIEDNLESSDYLIGVQSMFACDDLGIDDFDAFIHAEEIHENQAKRMRRTSEEEDHTDHDRMTPSPDTSTPYDDVSRIGDGPSASEQPCSSSSSSASSSDHGTSTTRF